MKKNIEIPALARVEGEGALYVRLEDGKVADIELNIYEPPRFFEGFLQGRYYQEVPDITARICGICPVAYQMSSVQALEKALGLTISEPVRALRKLLYCAEYIQSHALHVYMLQAPDLLGHESAISLAEVAPEVVTKALKLKKIGNTLMRTIGGRSVHPVSVCVGGFYRWPDEETIHNLLPDLEWSLAASLETVRWAANLPYPEFEMDYKFVALSHPEEYAIYEGIIKTSTGVELPAESFEINFPDKQVRHSTALHSTTQDGNPYLVGPLARLNLNFPNLRPVARQVCEEIHLTLPLLNPYKSLLARSIELVEVCQAAIELASSYQPAGPSYVPIIERNGEGCAVSEAPRGLLYHRYIVDQHGKVRFARITPPTAQNYPRIEADLWELAPHAVQLPDEEASLAFEHLIRSYDPCISCSTHFLKLIIYS